VAVSQANAERLIQLTVTGLPYLALLTASSQTSVDNSVGPPRVASPPPAKP